MTAHARRSPSDAERWMTCEGALNACEGIEEERSSEYAAEGTVAHEVRALSLDLGFEPHDFVGRTMGADGFSFLVTNEMADYLQPGIDRVRDLPGKMFVEHRVDLGRWLPGDFGTLDCGVVGEDTIWIDDLKFGFDPVNPVKNKQLRIYGLGFWDNIARHVSNAKRFVFSIDQPRATRGGGTWECTLDELLEFGEEVSAAGERTLDPDAPLKASKKGCHWCKRNPRAPLNGPGCPTLETFNLDVVGQKFEQMDEDYGMGAPPMLKRQSLLTPERRSFIYEHRSMFTTWLEAVCKDHLQDGIAGRETPGLKVIDGPRGDRKWIDEAKAEALLTAALADGAFTKKLKSPAAAEKDLKPGRKKEGDPDTWLALSALITQDEGKPALVPLDDPRPARKSVDQKFDDLLDT